MKNVFYTLLGLLLFLTAACGSKKAAQEIEEEDSFVSDTTYVKVKSKTLADDSLAQIYRPIIDKYMELSDALIQAQPADASNAAVQMTVLIKKANLKLLDSAQLNIWDEQMDAIVLFLDKIAKSKDLKIQRNEFYPLSEDLYDLIVQIGLKDYTFYKQYCPMAFRDKGAFWLSNSEEILNPYFGSEMLHCGEIKEKIINP